MRDPRWVSRGRPLLIFAGVGIGVRVRGAEGDTALRGANKFHHLDYFGRKIAGFLESLDGEFEIVARAEERCEGAPERLNRIRRNSRALESNDIDPVQDMGVI